MTFRVIRFKLTDDKYEVLITNLSKEEFTIDELKNIYHMHKYRNVLVQHNREWTVVCEADLHICPKSPSFNDLNFFFALRYNIIV